MVGEVGSDKALYDGKMTKQEAIALSRGLEALLSASDSRL